MSTVYICCSCDEHYGGDALACAMAIAAGTTTPCGCDCHKAESAPPEKEFDALIRRLRIIAGYMKHQDIDLGGGCDASALREAVQVIYKLQYRVKHQAEWYEKALRDYRGYEP